MTRIRFHRVGAMAVAATLSAAAIGVLPATSATAVGGSPAAHGADLGVVQAYVAGGARSAEPGDSLTFAFVVRNFGPAAGDISIDLRSLRGIQRNALTTTLSCVLPNGFVINPDGNSCEPGFVPGNHRGGSLVLTGVVDGTSNIVVRVCTSDLDSTPDPNHANDCRTLRVTLV